MKFRLLGLITALLALPSLCRAGYEQPNYIDGCQSADGRYVVTAECTQKAQTVHGPNRWTFHWLDRKTNQKLSFEPKGLQAGQVYGQLFVAPDGETLALWNHLTVWSATRSNMHGPPDLPYHEDTDTWRQREEFSRRILIYKKDGTLVKELGVRDLVTPEEWSSVNRVFNRVEWLSPYDKLHYRSTPRMQYALYRVSPDYTILAFQPNPPRGQKTGPREVRVSLTDGRILPPDEKLAEVSKVPVRPFQGPGDIKDNRPVVREGYVPSLDPVRTPGTFTVLPDPPPVLKLAHDGFKKLGPVCWSPQEQSVLLVEPEGRGLVALSEGKVKPINESVRLVAAAPEGRIAMVAGEQLWLVAKEGNSQVLLEALPGGKEWTTTSMTVSPTHVYLAQRSEEKPGGRICIVNIAKKSVLGTHEVAQWGDVGPSQGLALSPDGKSFFVSANVTKGKKSSIRKLEVRNDGGLDVESGKGKAWADLQGDAAGLAWGPDGNLYAAQTAGSVVVLNALGKRQHDIKVPGEGATGIAFGGADGRTLYVTAGGSLYSGRMYDGPPIVQQASAQKN